MAKPGTILLFDIDGTLAVTQGAGTRAMTRAFKQHFGIDSALAGLDFAGRSGQLDCRHRAEPRRSHSHG